MGGGGGGGGTAINTLDGLVFTRAFNGIKSALKNKYISVLYKGTKAKSKISQLKFESMKGIQES